MYLQYIPENEKANIFGEKWFNTEWKASKQLVWAKGDTFFMPETVQHITSHEQQYLTKNNRYFSL